MSELPPPQPEPPHNGKLPGTENVQGLATASMVIGIISAVFVILCFPVAFVLSLVGLPLAAVALAKISRGIAAPVGKGQAIAGLVLNVIAVALVVLFWLFLGVASFSGGVAG